MPNRILREGILTSERVNSLNWEAEVFYRRLMSVVDDFGRFSAHPSLLRAALYPLKLDSVRDANMERLLALVEQARLVRVYEVAGKRFLEMIDFRQQVRAKESKYPQPPEDAQQLRSRRTADEQQTQADAHVDGGGDVYEDVYLPPPQRAHDEKGFSMTLLWEPSSYFRSLAKQAGLPIPGSESFSAGLAEFRAYWMTRPETARSQHEWDHALLKSLNAEKVRSVSRPRARASPQSPKSSRQASIDNYAAQAAAARGEGHGNGTANERDITGEAVRVA